MVSAAVSKMGIAGLFFVKPGVKVNGKYYWDVLLSQQTLPAIIHLVGDNSMFQKDSTPAIRASDTIELLQHETADFPSPELCSQQPDLNPADYEIWGIMQQHVYEMQIHNVDEHKQRLVDVSCGLQQCC